MTPPKLKIGLLGGSFDPIHFGHTYIAAEAVRNCGLDKVIFMPCKQSPHKLSHQYAADAHRLAMSQLATEHLPWAEVSDYELHAPSPSYSWRTAEAMHVLHPDAELYWLMGTDQWESLPHWSRYAYFAELVKIIVFTRGTKPMHHPDLTCTTLHGWHPASATAIRLQPNGASATAWLHPAVRSYIKENDLYSETCLD